VVWVLASLANLQVSRYLHLSQYHLFANALSTEERASLFYLLIDTIFLNLCVPMVSSYWTKLILWNLQTWTEP